MRCLVSMVSEQTLPNILMIKTLKGIDRYLFITTQKMKDSGRLKWICDVCNILQPDTIEVKEGDFAAISQGLNNYLSVSSLDLVYLVNLTCGTKLMALAVYEVFRKQNAQMFYIALGQNTIHLVSPSALTDFLSIDYRLSVSEFLVSYGVSVMDNSSTNHPYAMLEAMFNFVAKSLDDALPQEINNLGQKQDNPRLMVSEATLTNLSALLGLSQQELMRSDWLAFIKGGWFEEYVAHWISTLFPEISAKLNLLVEKEGVQNELDIAVTYHNALFVMELKVAAKTADVKDFLYKLDSLRRDFGLYPRCFLLIANLKSEAIILRSSHYQKRAKKMGIPIFTYRDLMPQNIRNTLSNVFIC